MTHVNRLDDYLHNGAEPAPDDAMPTVPGWYWLIFPSREVGFVEVEFKEHQGGRYGFVWYVGSDQHEMLSDIADYSTWYGPIDVERVKAQFSQPEVDPVYGIGWAQ